VQGQDANGDLCRGRDFRHQNAQRLEFTAILVAQRWQRAQRHRFRPDAKRSPALGLQELAQSSIVSRVKGIVAIFTIAGSLTIAACSFFGPGEAVQEESGRTRYRAAEENPLDAPDVTPLREKVPGETR
jgi:hypothetical protein